MSKNIVSKSILFYRVDLFECFFFSNKGFSLVLFYGNIITCFGNIVLYSPNSNERNTQYGFFCLFVTVVVMNVSLGANHYFQWLLKNLQEYSSDRFLRPDLSRRYNINTSFAEIT